MADEMTIDSGALIFATLADVYLSSGMIDEAISILKDGLVRNPTYTLAKVILGRAYYMKDDIDEALAILEEAYEEAKESESANLYLGHCYKQRGDNDKAVMYYEATLKINPNNKDASEALEALKPAAKEVPKAPMPEPVEHEVSIEHPPEPTAEEVPEPVPEPIAKEIPGPTPEPTTQEPVSQEPTTQEPVTQEPTTQEQPPATVEEVVYHKEMEEAVEPSLPLESLNKPIRRLLSIGTVQGAFICSKDGLLIQDYCENRRDVEEMSALIAAIHNEAEQSSQFLKAGSVEKFIIEKGDETICVLVTAESLFTVITEPEAKPGLVFVYARKIIDEIREILG